MKRIREMFLIAGITIAALLCGCNQEEAIRHGGQAVIIFTDRSDPVYEIVFICMDGQVFAQVAEFPGHDNRAYYQTSKLPPELEQQVSEWIGKKADVRPPLVPDGPNFSITRVPQERSEMDETRYFKSSNQDIKTCLGRLKAHVVTEDGKVVEPPDWVLRDQRIKAHLGL